MALGSYPKVLPDSALLPLHSIYYLPSVFKPLEVHFSAVVIATTKKRTSSTRVCEFAGSKGESTAQLPIRGR